MAVYTPIPVVDEHGNPISPDDPRRGGTGSTTPADGKTEVEGGAIPTTTDEWKSKAEWEEYGRRQETVRGLREIAQIRRQAELDASRAKVAERESEIADAQKESMLAEGEQAIRQAQREAASLEVEAGLLSEVTQAQLDQRDAQIEEIGTAAAHAIEDAQLTADRERAEAAVMSAARGAGGSAVEQVQRDITAGAEREKGRIGTRRDIAQARLEAGKTEVTKRAEIQEERIAKQIYAIRGEALGEAERVLQTKDAEGNVVEGSGIEVEYAGIQAIGRRAALAAAGYEAAAAGLRLDRDALESNAVFGERAADEGLDALVNRPPIPDWNAIGRKAERARRWGNASSIVSTVGSIASWLF